jgi:hypothetical protein
MKITSAQIDHLGLVAGVFDHLGTESIGSDIYFIYLFQTIISDNNFGYLLQTTISAAYLF